MAGASRHPPAIERKGASTRRAPFRRARSGPCAERSEPRTHRFPRRRVASMRAPAGQLSLALVRAAAGARSDDIYAEYLIPEEITYRSRNCETRGCRRARPRGRWQSPRRRCADDQADGERRRFVRDAGRCDVGIGFSPDGLGDGEALPEQFSAGRRERSLSLEKPRRDNVQAASVTDGGAILSMASSGPRAIDQDARAG